MTNKRPTIKGKGADFFLDQDKSKPQELRKVTFYLSEALIDKLDNVWLDLRRDYRKLKKSDIARVALEELIKDYESNHQNSKLLEHLNVKMPKQH